MLSMNKSKTKGTLFSTNSYPERNVSLNTCSLNSQHSDDIIIEVPDFKYLGVYLNQYLNFHTHCDMI